VVCLKGVVDRRARSTSLNSRMGRAGSGRTAGVLGVVSGDTDIGLSILSYISAREGNEGVHTDWLIPRYQDQAKLSLEEMD
jgi:hypothetical protein